MCSARKIIVSRTRILMSYASEMFLRYTAKQLTNARFSIVLKQRRRPVARPRTFCPGTRKIFVRPALNQVLYIRVTYPYIVFVPIKFGIPKFLHFRSGALYV